MRSMISCAAVLALAVGCTANHPTTDNGQQSGETQGNAGDQTGSGITATCPLGEASFDIDLGAAVRTANLSIAVDANANLFVAGNAGLAAYSAMANLMFSLPAASLVQIDAQGNIYIAGSFTSRIELGGQALSPIGNIDVFVAKIDAKGNVLFVKQLGLCGDGVESMAISAKGNIAISGTAMGTVVLSASGDVLMSLQQSGFVAFDSAGNLLLAANNADGTIALFKSDVSGRVIINQSFDGQAQFAGIAVDANDHIFLIGATQTTIDFFGTSVSQRSSVEGFPVSGAFMVELDASNCSLVLVRDLGMLEANGIAIDAQGNIFIAGTEFANTGFFRGIAVMKIDFRGVMSTLDLPLGETDGRGLAVAVDACGALYVAVLHMASPTAGSAIDAEVLKVAL